jgi:hypothetical protein
VRGFRKSALQFQSESFSFGRVSRMTECQTDLKGDSSSSYTSGLAADNLFQEFRECKRAKKGIEEIHHPLGPSSGQAESKEE